jgi:5,10-methylenetetrahydromethanopterin reductase
MSGGEHRVGIGCIPRSYEVYPQWARAAEVAGFDSLHTGDSSTLWTDPFVTLSLAATVTTRPRLIITGTNPITRHPVAAAAAAASLQLLSGGRCSYGLGSGDSAAANIGKPRARLGEVEEFGRAVQDLTAGRTVDYRGQPLTMSWSTTAVPVLLCAEGPKTQQLAGRFADGAILFNGLTEDVVTDTLGNLARGAAEAGRTPDDLDLYWPVVFHLCDDAQAGREAIKFALAGTANRAFSHSLTAKLVPEELHTGFRALQQEYRSSAHQQLGAHEFNASLVDKYGLTDYLADRFAIVGTAAHCVDRLNEIYSYGVRNVVLSILSQDLTRQISTMQEISDRVFANL